MRLSEVALELMQYEAARVVSDLNSCSPALCTKLMWFIKRWSSTYLMPDMELYRNLGEVSISMISFKQGSYIMNDFMLFYRYTVMN